MNNLRSDLVKSYNDALATFAKISEQSGMAGVEKKFPHAEEVLDMEELVRLYMKVSAFIMEKQGQIMQSKSIDRTTLLGNRDSFTELKQRVTDQDLQGSLVVINIDINDLKKLNDENGHKAGDEYLAALGRAIKSNIRATDKAYRVGGDEFIIIMQCTEAEATRKVRDIYVTFKQVWADRYKVPGSFAYGIASSKVGAGREISDVEVELKERLALSKSPIEKFDAILNAADHNMYLHKNQMKLKRDKSKWQDEVASQAKSGNRMAQKILADHRKDLLKMMEDGAQARDMDPSYFPELENLEEQAPETFFS